MGRNGKGVSPFWDYIGMEEQWAKNGEAELKLVITGDLLNRGGSVQGGVLASLIDGVTGAAIASTIRENQTVVTTDLKISYLLPAKGDYLIAKGSTIHKGSTLAVSQAKIFNSKGDTIAAGMATFMILPSK